MKSLVPTAARGPSSGPARWAETLATLALLLWIGGLIALGVFVAPRVFGALPREAAGELMGGIFRGFDWLVLACVAVFAAGELARVLFGGLGVGWQRVRPVLAAAVVGCGLVASAWLSPQIQQLYERGVRRGVGPEGERLEAIHRRAETAGKVAALGGVAWLFWGAAFAGPAKTRGSEAS